MTNVFLFFAIPIHFDIHNVFVGSQNYDVNVLDLEHIDHMPTQVTVFEAQVFI